MLTGIRRRSFLVAAVVVAGAFAVSDARAEVIAFKRGNRVYSADTRGGGATLRGTGKIIDFAFGKAGSLYVTRRSRRSSSCDLYAARSGTPLVRWRGIRDQVDRFYGLCDIASDPTGGLLFEADNRTLASGSTWRIDPRSQLVRYVGFGYSPAMSNTGRRVVTVTRYYAPQGGGYQLLVMFQPGHEKAYRFVVPLPSRRSSYEYAWPSLSRDGQRLAAVRQGCGVKTCSDELVFGRVDGSLRSSGFAVASIHGTAWSADGRSLYVGAARSHTAARFDLYRVSLDGEPPVLVQPSISGWTMRGASMG